MKYLILSIAVISVSVHASRSGVTKISYIVIKPDHAEIYTEAKTACDGKVNRWHLSNTHPNYQALLSGFIATKAAGQNVDISGLGNCEYDEKIDWSYVLR